MKYRYRVYLVGQQPFEVESDQTPDNPYAEPDRISIGRHRFAKDQLAGYQLMEAVENDLIYVGHMMKFVHQGQNVWVYCDGEVDGVPTFKKGPE